MAASSSDENQSPDARKVDPTLIARPLKNPLEIEGSGGGGGGASGAGAGGGMYRGGGSGGGAIGGSRGNSPIGGGNVTPSRVNPNSGGATGSRRVTPTRGAERLEPTQGRVVPNNPARPNSTPSVRPNPVPSPRPNPAPSVRSNPMPLQNPNSAPSSTVNPGNNAVDSGTRNAPGDSKPPTAKPRKIKPRPAQNPPITSVPQGTTPNSVNDDVRRRAESELARPVPPASGSGAKPRNPDPLSGLGTSPPLNPEPYVPPPPRVVPDDFEKARRNRRHHKKGPRPGDLPTTTVNPNESPIRVWKGSPNGDQNYAPEKPEINPGTDRQQPNSPAKPKPRDPRDMPAPSTIIPPTDGRQTPRSKKTPNSPQSPAGGNSGGQQGTKKSDQAKKKALAKKYTGRDIDKLTPAELKEFKEGYKINNHEGKKYIQRKREDNGYPPLHLEDVNGKQIIAEGRSPSSRSISSPSTMRREFKNEFGEAVPDGDDAHHLIPVNVWQTDPLAQEIERRKKIEDVDRTERAPVLNVDDGKGLISLPSNADAMESTSQNLEKRGGRVKIAHPSSHDKWDKHVKKLLDKAKEELEDEFGSLDKVPIDRLEKSINGIRNQLRLELQEATRRLEKGEKNIESWIDPNYLLKPDPKKNQQNNQRPNTSPKKYPRIVNRPTQKDISAFRQTLAALKKEVDQPTQKYTMVDNGNLSTSERQAIALGYTAILSTKDSNYSQGEKFAFQRKGSEVGIYRQGDYTQVAVIDLTQGEISINRPLSEAESSWLVKTEKAMFSQLLEKQKEGVQKSRGFEIV